MGVSTNGQICFGIVFEDGQEFPWDDEKYEGDIEEWWREANGFEDVHQPFTDDGEYAKGWSCGDPRFEEYDAARKQWDKSNPVPVVDINYCSGDCPMYILAVPSTSENCWRGCPREIDVESLKVSQKDIDALLEFCEKYDLEGEPHEPKWWLSSYWG